MADPSALIGLGLYGVASLLFLAAKKWRSLQSSDALRALRSMLPELEPDPRTEQLRGLLSGVPVRATLTAALDAAGNMPAVARRCAVDIDLGPKFPRTLRTHYIHLDGPRWATDPLISGALGESLYPRLHPGDEVVVSDGSLMLRQELGPSTRTTVDLLIESAARYRADPLALRERLVAQAQRSAPQQALRALSSVLDAWPEDQRNGALLLSLAQHPAPALRRFLLEVADQPALAGTRAQLIAALLEDPDPAVRFGAAARSDDAPRMRRLAERDDVPATLRVSALEWLLARRPRAELVPLLSWLVGSEIGAAAVRLIAEHCAEERLELLRPLIDSGQTAEVRAAAVRALGQLGAEGLEAQLIAELAASDGELLEAVLEALGRIGGPDTIAAIRAASATRRLNDDQKLSAELAIDRVRARLGEVDTGRLSLVSGASPHGALSRPEGQGALSRPAGAVERDEP